MYLQLFSQMELVFVVMLRILGFFVSAPFFSGQYVNRYIKIGLSLLIAIMVVTNTGSLLLIAGSTSTFFAYAGVCVVELAIGLMIGFMTTVILNAIIFAGSLIDGQVSLTMAGMLDPLSATQMPITANLFYYALTTVILITNTHHLFIRGVFSSYRVLPIGQFEIDGSSMSFAITLMKDLFILAFKFASPIIAMMLVLDIGLGILVRTVPQMNIFVVGFPLKIAVYLLVMIMITELIIANYPYLIEKATTNLLDIIRLLVPTT